MSCFTPFMELKDSECLKQISWKEEKGLFGVQQNNKV